MELNPSSNLTLPILDEATVKKRKIVTGLAIGLLIIFSYLNQLIYRYQVPPGGDAINHNAIVAQILAGEWRAVLQYHFIWHVLVAGISLLTHARSITVMAWLGPLLLVSGGITLFFFNKKYFGWVAGLTALILFGFFSRQPLQTLYDGGFPDVLAGATVLPLVLWAVENISSGRRKYWTVPLALISLVVLLYSHHLTFLIGIAVLALWGIIQLLLWLNRRGWRWWQLLLVGLGAYGASLIVVGLFLNHTKTSAASLALMFAQINWHWPFIHLIGQIADQNQIFPIVNYPNVIGEAVVYLGTGGLVVAIGHFLRSSTSPRGRVSLLLLVWTVVLLAGSRNPHLGFPSRLMRDLAIPLTLLGGVFLQSVTAFCQSRRLPRILLAIIIVLGFGTGWVTFFARISEAVEPNSLVYHLPADTQMAQWITAHLPTDSTILTFPGDIYLPLFLKNQQIVGGYSEASLVKVTDPGQLPTVFPDVNYVYFQYRPDLPENGTNNRANLLSYQASPLLQQVTQTITPQEEIYIFKVLPTVKRRAQ